MVAKLVNSLRARGYQRGVAGPSPVWFAVWAGLGFATFVHRRLTKQKVVVHRIVLHSGETVEIRDTGVSRRSFGADES